MKPGDLVYLCEKDNEESFFVGAFSGSGYEIPAYTLALVLSIEQHLDNAHDDDRITVLAEGKAIWAFRVECLTEFETATQQNGK